MRSPADRAALRDPVAEAGRLIERASGQGITLRAVGGVAVWMLATSIRAVQPPRKFHDIDLVGALSQKREVAAFLEAERYVPNARFNTLAGDRLMFADVSNDRRLDVFLDRMEMCHTLELRGRLELHPEAVSPTDLLLTKLQIFQLTDRDVLDLWALLTDVPVEGHPGGFEADRLAEVCCSDWGWWRTVTGNLIFLEQRWRDDPVRREAARRSALLRELLERAPKTLRWRARALVGERISWYREPEEVAG